MAGDFDCFLASCVYPDADAPALDSFRRLEHGVEDEESFQLGDEGYTASPVARLEDELPLRLTGGRPSSNARTRGRRKSMRGWSFSRCFQ